MSNYLHVKEWRSNTKQKLIEALGSKCQICSYSKLNSALEFHHIDPSKKDFGISTFLGSYVKPWNKLADEVSKCVLLCANCHREIHNGATNLPVDFQRFDESLITTNKEKPKDTKCLNCDTLKDYKLKFCKPKCATDYNAKIKLSKEEMENLLIKYKGNLTHISNEIGVSDNGFKKRCLRNNLIPKNYR